MNWQRIVEFADRTRPHQEMPAPGTSAGFMVVPLPGGAGGGPGLSLVEALYRCAFERAQADLQRPPVTRDLFAVWN